MISLRYLLRLGCCDVFIFFFFSSRRRHTRSLRDWSSDVCSSDLAKLRKIATTPTILSSICSGNTAGGFSIVPRLGSASSSIRATPLRATSPSNRSEERRVGKECRSRWVPDRYRKKEILNE